jgi:predicted MPP superfamily phosphohydrolase
MNSHLPYFHLLEQDALQPSGWTPPDPETRRAWHQARRHMEALRLRHTPDGPRTRHAASNALEAVVAVGNWTLQASGLARWSRQAAHQLRIVRLDVPRPDLPAAFDGYRILHITDPHFDAAPGLSRHIVELAAGEAPDLCAVTGDLRFRSRGIFTELGIVDDLAELRRGISCRDGFLVTLGNHDTHEMADRLEHAGFRVLTNENAVIRRSSETLHLAGIDDVHYYSTPAAAKALGCFAQASNHFGIALVHSPELAGEAAHAGFSLYLCGHTHGGQICLRAGRPLIRHLHRHRDLFAGHWRIGDMDGYTSHGAGTSGMPLRFRCPGEITLITLRKV